MSDEQEFERRLRFWAILVVAVFALLWGRLAQLQLVQGEEFARRAESNRLRLLRTGAPRGLFYDRWGRVLVSNRSSFAVVIWPDSLGPDREAVLARLAQLIQVPVQQIQELLQAGSGLPFSPVMIKTDLDPATVTALQEQRQDLPGVVVQEMPRRYYPYGSLAAHLIGYMGAISPDELREWQDQGYVGTDWVGKDGLERQYEHVLHGQSGGEQVEVDAWQRPAQILGDLPPVPGENLWLTIDLPVQMAAEEALRDEIARLDRARPKVAHTGVAIALDPRSGAILALASQPAYDPNILTNGPNRGEYYQSLVQPPSALINRALRGLYPPGSTFKPVTAIAALMTGKTTPEEEFYADDIGPYGKKDWTLNSGLPPHGWVNLARALAVSCNDYFWEMGGRVGVDALAEYARLLGFGQPTQIDLFPGDLAGNVPDRAYKARLYPNGPAWQRLWYPAETLDFAIGQGYLTATPLQVAQLYELIANRGRVYRPYVVQGLLDANHQLVSETKPQLLREVNLPDAVWEAVEKGLEQTLQPGGTAAGSFYKAPYLAAGKTGTAEVAGSDAHGWFAAYAPVGAPEIVVTVLVEHGLGGSAAAAPIGRKMLDAYFAERKDPPPLPTWLRDTTGSATEGRKLDTPGEHPPT